MEIDLYLDKTIEQNAAVYFEKSKKLKKKVEGAKEAIAVYEKKLAELEKKRNAEKEEFESRIKPKESRKKEWYEKFRWFYSSEGFLVIGGRDATSNEIVIKKHAEKGDMVFHTDLAGSPFFVVKSEGKQVGEQTLRETADATVTFSRVFKLGQIHSPVFYVTPDQVTKEANAGEYLTKGAFVIRGKTNYIENKINLAIGIMQDGKLMAAPLDAVKKHCSKYLWLTKGEMKPSEIAKKIKHELGGDIDEIIRLLPSGEMAIKK